MQDELIEELWYHIPGFNGYLIDKYGVVKSLKNFKAYPEGIFINSKTDRQHLRYYILSDNRNERRKMYVHELLDLVKNSESTYHLRDNEVYLGGRNRGYMNYQKKHPNNKGIVKIDIREGTTIIPRKEKEEVKLDFPSFEKFNEEEKKPEQIVKFY